MLKIQKILEERGSRYGDFADNAQTAQDLKMVLYRSAGFCQMSPVQQEALEVICQKISRIVTGNPNYDDNWVDIIGYTQLVIDRLEK
jgi:hypothetical protein